LVPENEQAREIPATFSSSEGLDVAIFQIRGGIFEGPELPEKAAGPESIASSVHTIGISQRNGHWRPPIVRSVHAK
jgi:hypothetical protein